ncbi:MAG: hypothetical protein U0640_10515 [Phycisphaerales bacterium]
MLPSSLPNSLRSLLTDLIDYAGLFPPAKLDMQSAVETYNRCNISEQEWMLGRFICPVSRLGEFEKAASLFMPGTAATSGYREMAEGQPWRLSVLVEVDQLAKELDAIHAFNERHANEVNGLAEIDMCELKITSPQQIDDVLDEWPEGLFPFFEFPVTMDCRGFVAALSGSPAAAKIRTGGVVGNAFPQPAEVSAFLRACAASDVAFKATAGLHHAVRGAYRLTYEKDSASCTMHGFLNLFIAAALVRARNIDDATTIEVLTAEDPDDFKFSNEVLGWKGHLIETAEVAKVREAFALSFGSCSFDEPVEEVAKVTK